MINKINCKTSLVTLFIFALLSLVLLYDLNYMKKYIISKKKEGFTGGNFSDCINSGFTKEFCIKTPYSYGPPGACRCNNGQMGLRLPGWGGKCMCPAYISPYFSLF